MNDFAFYFEIGWKHIVSWDALDHLLFIAALSAVYLVNDWKPLLILITAFTIGHSLTLALSVYDLVRFNSRWVEFLIPLTILATAIWNLFQKDKRPSALKWNYALALSFGLIHGMGFANTIRFMLASSQEILVPLLGFNLGIEAGQITVVLLLLLAGWLLVRRAGLRRTYWTTGLSVIAGCFALYLCILRWPL